MSKTIRGADLVAGALARAGLRTVFTLSGNHIMPIFDAALDVDLELVHVRHEAAAVHMADAFARLTGRCGIALVTGGAGHANAVAALCTALAAEAPLVLLSGHAGLNELGRGAFQELRQADMAQPVAKASWTAASAATLAHDVAKAVRIALSGRPGPVHVSLPVDLLEASVAQAADLWPDPVDFTPRVQPLGEAAADAALAALAAAERPLVLFGPTMAHAPRVGEAARLSDALGVPALTMESPRGISDPALGAFGEALAQADLVALIGKPHDFTLRFAEPPFVDAGCRFVAIDPDPALLGRVAAEKGDRLVLGAVADATAATRRLVERARPSPGRHAAWRETVRAAVQHRPAAWSALASGKPGLVHPVAMCAAVAQALGPRPDATLVCDGGEIGQWAQSLLPVERRVINGVAGSIGAAVPFAIAARAAAPDAPVVAVMGDGAFGFHAVEFDTAVRYGLPFVMVVGNDAGWNAERQIQVRSYGPGRVHGCDLLPTRYDRMIEALGGHGEFVDDVADLLPALERAFASGKPACVNVMIEPAPAPVVRRSA